MALNSLFKIFTHNKRRFVVGKRQALSSCYFRNIPVPATVNRPGQATTLTETRVQAPTAYT